MRVIAGSSNLPLAKNIAQKLGVDLVEVKLNKFANDEKRVHVTEDVQGENLIIVQSFSEPVDEHIMEFLLIADALERLGAKHVNAVIPWFGYSLQDKVFNQGESLSAKVVARLISTSYIKRTFLLDVHNPSIAGFFSVPTHHLAARSLFKDYIQSNYDLKNVIVASPDFGGLKRAWSLADDLDVDWVSFDKRRNSQTGEIVRMGLQGEVEGKVVLVIDDVIVSGGTVVEAAEALKSAGAKEVHFLSTHCLLVGDSDMKLENSPVDKIIITNSVQHSNLPSKFEMIDATPVFAQQLAGWMK